LTLEDRADSTRHARSLGKRFAAERLAGLYARHAGCERYKVI
jgi:hypothetical protein